MEGVGVEPWLYREIGSYRPDVCDLSGAAMAEILTPLPHNTKGVGSDGKEVTARTVLIL